MMQYVQLKNPNPNQGGNIMRDTNRRSVLTNGVGGPGKNQAHQNTGTSIINQNITINYYGNNQSNRQSPANQN